jgi:phosphate transport system substrate-binding protein
MKKITWVIIGLVVVALAVLIYVNPFLKKAPAFRTGEKGSKDTISMSGAFALYPMAVRWAEEYGKIHPGVKFDVTAGGAGKGMADVLSKAVDIGKVSREIKPAEIKNGAFFVAVVKDAVVPTMNERNPGLKAILGRGIKKGEFKKIWLAGTITDWGKLAKKAGKSPMNVYTRSDSCGAAETWAKYLGAMQEDLKGVGIYGDPGIAEAIKRDALGIGYNNINYAYDAKTGSVVKGLKIIPIDLNSDGKIEADENFYSTEDALINAIASGKYPSPPARDLYFVTKGRPKGIVKDFISWVLTDGQKFVRESGYIALSKDKLAKGLKKIK